MITMEDWVTIRNIKKHNPDIGTRTIGELLGISRNTVKRALQSEGPPEYERTKILNPAIVHFSEYIVEGLILKKLKGSRLLSEITAKGYTGSKSAFYRYLVSLHIDQQRTYQRYETAPGEQMQFDWSPYEITINGETVKIQIFCCILGFSRYRIYEASLGSTQAEVFEALENSYAEFGGVTGRIQTDNARVFVDNASRIHFKWNEQYLALCGHYGIEPEHSLPKHPWSKGKVENSFSYLNDHFIAGNSFDSLEDFFKRLKVFQETVNTKVHTTTQKSPCELFELEKSSLAALPSSRFSSIKTESRKVTEDCLISFNGNRYSVPYVAARKTVWIKLSKGYLLEIYSQNNLLLAVHPISLEKGKIIMNKEHYANHSIERGNFNRMTELFREQFAEDLWLLDKLKEQKRINPGYHLTRIMDLAKYYPAAQMRKGFQQMNACGLYSYIFLKTCLENTVVLTSEELRVALREEKRTNVVIPDAFYNVNIKRSLTDYQLK